MRVDEGVGAVDLDDFGIGDRFWEPAAVGLASDVQYSARYRHGHSVGGELAHERVEPDNLPADHSVEMNDRKQCCAAPASTRCD